VGQTIGLCRRSKGRQTTQGDGLSHGLLAALLLCAGLSLAADLKPETIEAFDRHIAATEARLKPRFRGDHFLWSDESSDIRQQLARGAIAIRPQQGNGTLPVKGGLIEDWLGAVFVPRANLQSVLAIVQDYDRHAEVYKPDIQAAKLLSRNGDEFQMRMRVLKAKFFLSVVFNIERDIRFVAVDATKAYSRSYSHRITEVSDPGKPSEHELPVGQDRGLLWRMYSYWFYEQRDGGVYITCESISLTRDIPFGMRKVFGPIIEDVPGESVRTGMEQTRRAILAAETKP
jgi:hypothetical protein